MVRLLRVCAVAVATLLLVSAAPIPKTNRPNILLVVVDTLRFDAVNPETTPFLASLGKRAIVFTHAYSTHDFTPTSHFSMFTGLRDGLGGDLDGAELGVPFQLQRAGYATFATVANDMIGTKQMPVLRGFGDFKDLLDVRTNPNDLMMARTTIDMRLAMYGFRPTQHARAIAYFNAGRLLPLFANQIRAAKAPYFGFVNLVDPHEPYIPDPDYYAPETKLPPGFAADVLTRRVDPELEHPEAIVDPARRQLIQSLIAAVKFPRLVAIDISSEALQIYHRRYLAKVKKADATLKLFFDDLERQHALDNTIVIVTSDHGEEFGESHFITHMLQDKGNYEATHHVPLLVILPPKMARKTAVVDREVSIDMIAPTIYDFAGLDPTPLRQHIPGFAPSLTRLIAPSQPYVAVAAIPPKAQHDPSAATERERAMKSLGYIQ
ncbi:MAG TPA: sulfatase-like hydrolase/transferase [Thermoanaerobaculia bacterium]|jgi:arylsulfatase A-like enzyme|nr:sulfatase-like hydrolase/transferase [Thermoanaerobaculia bacterium]